MINSYPTILPHCIKALALRHRRLLVISLNLSMVVLGYGLALLLRIDFRLPNAQAATLLTTLPLLMVCRALAYHLYKLDSGLLRFVTILDLWDMAKAVAVGSLIFLAITAVAPGLPVIAIAIIVLEAILNFAFLAGSRISIRRLHRTLKKSAAQTRKCAVVVGAGDAGAALFNEIRSNPALGIKVVGFLDDDPNKRSVSIQGVRVIGKCDDFEKLIGDHHVAEVFVCIPSAPYKRTAEIARQAKAAGLKVKVLPSLSSLIQQNELWTQLREATFDELLGRPVIEFGGSSNLATLQREIAGSRILITGAAGSIGSELCRQVAQLHPRLLVLYDRNENDSYFLELEIKRRFPECRAITIIGDVLDHAKLRQLIKNYRIDLIYHAAAYKHVPMMEREPFEAIRNNVLATKVLAEVALDCRVAKCVYISTDKAVNPTSIMGVSKRVGELVMQGYSGNGTKFITVRFGNVIGSNGSVIHVFRKQIREGGPVTITDPEVTRYFMAISEAVQLVIKAGALGQGGEIFLLDMGKPVRIVDLAKKMIVAAGLVPERDIEIKYIGLRPGEKLSEQLYWQGENIIATPDEKITMLKPEFMPKERFFPGIAHLENRHASKDVAGLIAALTWLVPECSLGNRNGHKTNGYRKLGTNGHNHLSILKLNAQENTIAQVN